MRYLKKAAASKDGFEAHRVQRRKRVEALHCEQAAATHVGDRVDTLEACGLPKWRRAREWLGCQQRRPDILKRLQRSHVGVWLEFGSQRRVDFL